VLAVSILSLSTIFRLALGIIPTKWYFLVFHGFVFLKPIAIEAQGFKS
jgi:hypothetical protein